MQTRHILLFAYVSLVWSLRCLAKKGGGGGDYSGDDDGDGDDGGDGGGSSSDSGDVPYEPVCTTCECKERDQRVIIYSLPGSYYNGTVTINHVVSANSARDAAAFAQSRTGCPSDDASPKTYSYPALFTVGSNLNSSDVSPIFWNLRAFKPAGQYEYPKGNSHIFTEWIHVRSSDFASEYWSTGDISSSWPEETHTYWDTNVVSNGPSDWTANATYTAQPQEETSDAVSVSNPHFIVRSSNYITLADVCAFNQELYFSDGTSPETSPIPPDSDDISNTIPTIFFDLGAQASLQNIGGASLQFTLQASVHRQVVGTGHSLSDCPGASGASPYYQTLEALQWREAAKVMDKENLWNLSASVTLNFDGALVTENSTDILPNSTALPVWDQKSKITSSVVTSTPSTAASSGAVEVKPGSLVLVLGILVVVSMAFV